MPPKCNDCDYPTCFGCPYEDRYDTEGTEDPDDAYERLIDFESE